MCLKFFDIYYKYCIDITMMEETDIEQSTIMERIDLQELEIVNNPITKILSYSLSLNRKKMIIATENGLCIINNSTRKYKKYEN